MKFLFINNLKDSFEALPPEKQVELMKGAFAFADKYLKNGKCKMIYSFSNGKGTASIWDLESAEEDMSITLEYALAPYVETQRIPVVEYEAAGKIMGKMMAAAQKAAKK